VDAALQSFLLVFFSEMGDKTQLLALVLAAKFRAPVAIMLGILTATLLNHALASYAGAYVGNHVREDVLRWMLALTFFGFGIWILIPDKDEGLSSRFNWGPFATTTVAFFLAEMGDKTQLATLALGAKFSAPELVTIGTTLGMLGADGLAVYFGHKFTTQLPMNLIRRVASALFILFGLYIAVGM
jgi:Ca2+/H+ antiporter, TMEM165/GDT1 family